MCCFSIFDVQSLYGSLKNWNKKYQKFDVLLWTLHRIKDSQAQAPRVLVKSFQSLHPPFPSFLFVLSLSPIALSYFFFFFVSLRTKPVSLSLFVQHKNGEQSRHTLLRHTRKPFSVLSSLSFRSLPAFGSPTFPSSRSRGNWALRHFS